MQLGIKEFYYLRHGKTQANLDGLMCGGKWDIPLANEGVEQAGKVAPLFEKHKLVFPNAIFSSPMIRAQQTAAAVARVLNLPIHTLPGLAEWDIGHWDRQTFESVKHMFLGTDDPAGGETREQLRERVKIAILESAELSTLPLLVSHGGVGWAVQELLGLNRLRMENCGLHHFRMKNNGIWEMVIVG